MVDLRKKQVGKQVSTHWPAWVHASCLSLLTLLSSSVKWKQLYLHLQEVVRIKLPNHPYAATWGWSSLDFPSWHFFGSKHTVYSRLIRILLRIKIWTETLELNANIIEASGGARKWNIRQLAINIGFAESRFQRLQRKYVIMSWLQTINVNVVYYRGKDLRGKQILTTQSHMIPLRRKRRESLSKENLVTLYSVLW